MALLPTRLRSRLLEGALGQLARDAVLLYPNVFGDRSRVMIGEDVWLNNTLFNVASGEIRIGDHSFFGHGVSLLTGTHDVRVRGSARPRAVPTQGRDIVIGKGVWVSSNATVLGPCVIGDHAVVAAGAVVVEDVAPRTVVAGVPAKALRTVV